MAQGKCQRQKGAGGVQDSEGWSTRAEAGTGSCVHAFSKQITSQTLCLKQRGGGNAVRISKSSSFSQWSPLPLAVLHEITSLHGWVMNGFAHVTTVSPPPSPDRKADLPNGQAQPNLGLKKM